MTLPQIENEQVRKAFEEFSLQYGILLYFKHEYRSRNRLASAAIYSDLINCVTR